MVLQVYLNENYIGHKFINYQQNIMKKYIFILLGLIIQSCSMKSNLDEQLYKIEVDAKFGFINEFGEEVIPPSYMYATDFNEGVALVVIDTLFTNNFEKCRYKYNYINHNNKKIFKNDFTLKPSIGIFFTNDKDKVIEFLSRFNFSCGLALNQEVKDSSLPLYGYINFKGDVIIPHEYMDGLPFSENKTYVQQSIESMLSELKAGQSFSPLHYKHKWKIINSSNESLTDYIFSSTANDNISTTPYNCLTPYKNNRSIGFIAINTTDSIKYTANLLDENGRIIKIMPNIGEEFDADMSSIGLPKMDNPWKYGLHFTFSKNIIVQNSGVLSGFGCSSRFFNTYDGTEIPTFEQLSEEQQLKLKSTPIFRAYLGSEIPITYAGECAEDLIPCQFMNFKNLVSSWFYVNKHLCIMGTDSNYVFHDALPFSNGLAAVKKDGKWGYINSDFDLIIPYQYNYAEPFNGNLAKVKIKNGNNQIISYINKWGQVVWQNIEYSDPQIGNINNLDENR